ncbi:CoA-binding protein [Candidatus Marsarchaeota archaeon]|nr:CoA-binding protein [Candidatus Marsarchaeota archaeon]
MPENNTEDIAKFILQNFRTIAIVGCSREPGKPSHDVPKYLQAIGYKIIPVNPFADFILGEKCYKNLNEIKENVDVVDVFRPSNEALEIARQAMQIHAKALWLQEGIISNEAERFANENGMMFVMNRCMMKEHIRVFDG